MQNKTKLFLISLIPVQVIFLQVLKYFPEFVEVYYSTGIFPLISEALRFTFGWIPFSVGDLLILENEMTVPCDCILISGAAVLNESMLTGEPMPCQKLPLVKTDIPNPDQAPILDEHNAHAQFIYAGTKIIQSSDGPLYTSGRAVAVIFATGGLTAKARLLRMVLFPSESRFLFDRQYRMLYGVLMLYSLVMGLTLLGQERGGA